MPARIAGIQVRKDASGDIHVNLDSSTPCWNDAIEGTLLELAESASARIFEGEHEVHEGFLKRFKLRALRVLRGDLIPLEFQRKKLLCVVEHDFFTNFRFQVYLLKFFQPALHTDGRPVGAKHRFIL